MINEAIFALYEGVATSGSDRRRDEARHEPPDGTADARRLHRPRRLSRDPPRARSRASAIRSTGRARCSSRWSTPDGSAGSPARASTSTRHDPACVRPAASCLLPPADCGLLAADRLLSMYCQVCGLKNSEDEEFCARCNSKLLVLSGVGVVEESGEPQEEIPFDEHLLERISTLEDVVKRTAEAVKSLFESMGNLEKNLFVAHTGILALQETLERRGAVRAEEVVDLWESKMDERMQAVEKKDRFLERRDRIIAPILGADRDGFLKQAARGRVRDPRPGRRPGHPGARGALPHRPRATSSSASTSPRRSFPAGSSSGPSGSTSRRSSRSTRTTSSPSSTPGSRPRSPGDTAAAEASLQPRDRAQARRVPAALRARDSLRAPCRGGRTPSGRCVRALDAAPVPSAQILLGTVLREKGELTRAIQEFEEARAPRARLRGGRLPARPLLPREELDEARARLLPAGAREEPAAARVPGGGAAARAPPRIRAAARGRARRRRLPGRGGERLARDAGARTSSTARPWGRSPRNPTIRISFALLAASLGRWKEAIAACREVLASDPEDVVAAAACSTAGRGAARGGQPEGGGRASCATSSTSTPPRPRRRSGTTSSRPPWRSRGRTSTGARLRRPRARRGARRAEALSARGARMGPLQAARVRPGDRLPAPLERARGAADDVSPPRHGLPRGRPAGGGQGRVQQGEDRAPAAGARGPNAAAGALQHPPGREVRPPPQGGRRGKAPFVAPRLC